MVPYIRARPQYTISAKLKNSYLPAAVKQSRIAVATTISTAQERNVLLQSETYQEGAGQAGVGRTVSFECVRDLFFAFAFAPLLVAMKC